MMVSKGLKLEKIEREREDFNINVKGRMLMTITKSELLSVIKRVKLRQDATNNSIYVSKDSNVSKLSLPEGCEVEFVEK